MSKVLKGFVEGPTGVKIIRDADSKLDYIVDLAEWLSGDTLSAVSYEVSGATVNSCAINVAPLSIAGEPLVLPQPAGLRFTRQYNSRSRSRSRNNG